MSLVASSFMSHIPIAASPTSWPGVLAGGFRGYMAGMVVCSSWLEREKKLGTQKLVDGGMQLVRLIHTYVQGYFVYLCDDYFLLSTWSVHSEEVLGSACMATFLNVRVSDSHAAECAQVISSSSSQLRRGSASDHQYVANPKVHHSHHLVWRALASVY